MPDIKKNLLHKEEINLKGLVHIYTGNGKGKTTAAIGLGIRAYGSGFKVLMIQFMKGRRSGEELILTRLGSAFELCKHKSSDKFSWELNHKEKEELKDSIAELFEYAIKSSGSKDLIILDEIMAAVNNGFIDLSRVIDFIKNKPDGLELVMTGRKAPQDLIELADYVSEFNAVRHPFTAGIPARKGIEY
ncbi:MAG: cob(I)yrinic acid a,c-diamide adenosyltransferase [Eubacterium sp.]|jgi:cob(I)alamin adenosyltransferase|nr:cob(I)yrinic acid a,c-diamide adenosyltransferase [Eubacterium sp.]